MIFKGFITLLVGGIGILVRGGSNLAKGEANASFHAGTFNNLLGIVFSLLFWGGIALMVLGVINRSFGNRD